MGSSLARVPEPAIMSPDEEGEYIRCNSIIFKGAHPIVQTFATCCPGFLGDRTRILDVGCGLANMSVEFAKSFPEADVVGVDVSAAMLRYARMMVDHFKLGDRISVCCAQLPDADFGEPDRSFDLVFARSVLHHFADPADFWKTVAKYAKEDAAVFVVDLLRPPSLAVMEERVWERFGNQLGPLRSAFQMSLLASHTLDEVEDQLEKANLRGLVAAPYPEGTHVTVWRPGRFGKRAP